MKQTTPDGTRGAAYVRVSYGEDEDTSESQRAAIREWAARHGLKITVWYQDIEGRNSRHKAERREEFQRMLRDIRAGRLDWVVVRSQDRFGVKHQHEFGKFICEFIDHDCQLWTIKDELLSSTEDAAVFTSTVGNVTSRKEQKEKGERSLTGKLKYAARGEWQGGYVPYGYDVVSVDRATGEERWRVVILRMIPTKKIWQRLRIFPDGKTQERCDGKDRFPRKQDHERFVLAPSILSERVETAKEIFKLFASGSWTVRGLAQRLNQRKIDPVVGEGWYHTRLKPMLANPAYYIGATVYNKNSHGEFCWRSGGKLITPPERKGKVVTGRKNDKKDWVFPPGSTAIITEELWNEVQTRLSATKPTIKRGLRDERFWLAGLLVCGKCGQKMTGNAQDELSYRCTTYVKFGKLNPYGCRLHRVTQDTVESVVNQYLETIAPDVKALLETRNNPALLNEVHKKLATREQELWNVLGKMKSFVLDRENARELIRDRRNESLQSILDDYRDYFDQDRRKLEAELAEKEAELEKLVTKMNRIPDTAKNAIAVQQKLIEDVDARVADLKARLVPLTDQLEAVYSDLESLDSSLTAALEAAPGDDARRKALTLRRVVERIVLHFEHTDRPAKDRRSKNATVRQSVLTKADFVPVTGQTFTLANQPGPG
jgi:DNA invertase Pin-like site-specific DNA recombinase